MAAKKVPTPRAKEGIPEGTGLEPDIVSTPSNPADGDNLPLLDDLPFTFSIELGRTRLPLAEITSMGEESLIELDRTVTEPVDILLNGRLFARGEVVTVSESFGVRITEILGRE